MTHSHLVLCQSRSLCFVSSCVEVIAQASAGAMSRRSRPPRTSRGTDLGDGRLQRVTPEGDDQPRRVRGPDQGPRERTTHRDVGVGPINPLGQVIGRFKPNHTPGQIAISDTQQIIADMPKVINFAAGK